MALRELPKDTVRLIKSTQVITTPASIVKELLENALDAGATTISIKLDNYGFSLIEVRDNGSGIKEEDTKYIAKPHFTSKISSFSDLDSLGTYGFRGEALASLCAVSDCRITTKTDTDSMAHMYTFNQLGDIATAKPAAAPTGTTVCVSNLFKNVPVRRQYYNNSKRRKEEMKKVEDLMLSFSLAAPGVHFTLSHDKSCVMQKSPAQDMRGALINTFPSVYKDLVKKDKNIENLSVKVEVYLPSPECRGSPGLSRTSADRLFILVNQRPVTHKPIEKLVKGLCTQGEAGCHGRYPVGVLAFTLPPGSMDINLEPNKTKIFFKDEDVILEAVKEILTDLYPSVSTASKGGKKTGGTDSDITCTFSCITQPQGDHDSSSVPRKPNWQNSNTHHKVHQDDFDFSDEDDNVRPIGRKEAFMLKRNPIGRNLNFVNSGNQNFERSNKTLTGTTQNRIPNALPANPKIIGRSEHTKTDKNNDKENIHNIESKMLTSTQDSKTDGIFPSASESCIASVDNSRLNFEITDSGISSFSPLAGTSRNRDISGIVPFSPSLQSNHNTSRPHLNSQRSEQGRECSTPVQENSTPGLQASVKSEITRENSTPSAPAVVQPAEQDCAPQQPERNTSQLHQSIMGSDGVPVFQIAPLSPLENILTSNLNDQNNSSLREAPEVHAMGIDAVNQRQHKFRRISTDPVSTSHTGSEPQRDSSEPVGTSIEQQGSAAGSWSRGFAINGKDIQTVQVATTSTLGDSSKKGDRVTAMDKSGGTTIVNKDEGMKTMNSGDGVRIVDRSDRLTAMNKSDGATAMDRTGGVTVVDMGDGMRTMDRSDGVTPMNRKDGVTTMEKSEGVAGGGSKRIKTECDGDAPSVPQKKAKINSLGPANFDYIHGKPIKRPSSPFILFSRDIRSQVLSEHPGEDFAFIAKQMAGRWKALDMETKLHYNDLAKAESERYQDQVRKLQESRGLNTSVKLSYSKGQMTKGSLDRYVAPMTPHLVKSGKTVVQKPIEPQRPWLNRCKQVPFTLTNIKDRLRKRRLQETSSKPFSLLGSVGKTEGGWICLQDDSIAALNIYRLYERIMVHTMHGTLKVPMKSLDDPLPFNASSLGEENWVTLLELPRQLCSDRNMYNVTDNRLTHNGFQLALSQDNKGMVTHGEVSHMTLNVGFIGIIDLKEILASITASPAATVHLTRPLKIQYWIKAEAVRMIRSGPNIVQREDVQEKLNKWMVLDQSRGRGGEALIGQQESCIHNKPILSHLYSLHDLPQPQSQRSFQQ